MTNLPNERPQNLALRSTISSAGRLSLSVAELPVDEPGEGEVLVRIEAAPINPSDLLTLLGPAELSSMVAGGSGSDRVLTAAVSESRLPAYKGPLDKPVAVGNEGSGTVVGAGPGQEHLLGKKVSALKGMGARYVCNSNAVGFRAELADAIEATGATLAFDAVGGGRLAHQILRAMETATRRGTREPYGSEVKKQLYVYGRLDRSALELDWDYGTQWSVGIFVMTNLMRDVGPARTAELRGRIVREMKTTFASHYAATIGLFDLLDPQMLAAIAKMATGRKYLLDPARPPAGV